MCLKLPTLYAMYRLAAGKTTDLASTGKGKANADETSLKQYLIKLAKSLMAGKEFQNAGTLPPSTCWLTKLMYCILACLTPSVAKGQVFWESSIL